MSGLAPSAALPLTAEQRDLAGAPASLALAKRIARWFGARHAWIADDLQGAALLGLVTAAQRYRAEVGEFAAFAKPCVAGAVWSEIRIQYQRGFSGARGVTVPVAALPRPLLVRDRDAEPVGAAIEVEEAVRNILRYLPQNQREVLTALYLRAGSSPTSIAAERGIALGNVCRAADAGIETLRAGRRAAG